MIFQLNLLLLLKFTVFELIFCNFSRVISFIRFDKDSGNIKPNIFSGFDTASLSDLNYSFNGPTNHANLYSEYPTAVKY